MDALELFLKNIQSSCSQWYNPDDAVGFEIAFSCPIKHLSYKTS